MLEEENATVFGTLMILLSVLSALSVIYDIVIHFNVKSEYEAVMNERGTKEYQVYWNLYEWSLIRIGATILLLTTIIFSWLNNILMDFYKISLPVAFITFVYYAVIIAEYPAQIANVNLLSLQRLAEKVDDQGEALERFETVKT